MRVKIDTKILETMLFIWASLSDREKIADTFLIDLANDPNMAAQYDENFNADSVRKVLSAISNRERMNNPTKKESRFWNNNMWMMEDPLFPESMLRPVKTLSPTAFEGEGDKEVNLVFYPGTTETYFIKGNTLFINFFTIRANAFDENAPATIEDLEVDEFIKQKLAEIE